ncbi:hypothetical protein V6R21_32345 [Limibacter armeniacum]|uniref:hypothetical protein n=1 Tax=Limibacter armeniacum TaxID=466084 RepID=UPI002FE63195
MATIYYITEKKTETGKKFQELERRMEQAYDDQIDFCFKYNIKHYRPDDFAAQGGFSSVTFDKDVEVDTKVWKNVYNSSHEWMPKLNTKLGKTIQKEMDECLLIGRKELNQCVGYKGFPNHIGYSFRNKKYYGFMVSDTFKFDPPKDCKEITFTEYKHLFINNNE